MPPKYHRYICYVHNLGKFDVVFWHKILLDYNLNIEDKYILTPLYRENQILGLIVSLKLKNKKRKH